MMVEVDDSNTKIWLSAFLGHAGIMKMIESNVSKVEKPSE
jgi:hypothetical protein